MALSGLERYGKGAQRSRLLAAGHAMRSAVHVPAAVAASVTEHILAWVKSQHQVVHLPELRRLADLMMQVQGGGEGRHWRVGEGGGERGDNGGRGCGEGRKQTSSGCRCRGGGLRGTSGRCGWGENSYRWQMMMMEHCRAPERPRLPGCPCLHQGQYLFHDMFVLAICNFCPSSVILPQVCLSHLCLGFV